MAFTAKFIPDPSIVDGIGTPDIHGYYDVVFEFLHVIEIIETEPQQLVCCYSLELDGTILNYRFSFSYSYDGSNATAEAAELALSEYMENVYREAIRSTP